MKHQKRGHGLDAVPSSASQQPNIVRGNADAHVDPVCGMTVMADPQKALDYEGKTYYFCNPKCAEKFSADPHRYLPKHDTPPPPAPTATTAKNANAVYTCPMHPEVRRVGPGSCPICGMALEPLEATSEADTSELEDMTRRFWVSAFLTLPLLVVTMSEFIPGLDIHHALGANMFNWLQAALATPVVLWGGWPFFARAWASFKTWNLNISA